MGGLATDADDGDVGDFDGGVFYSRWPGEYKIFYIRPRIIVN